MGTRFAALLAPAALMLGLAGCDDSRASSQASAPAATAMAQQGQPEDDGPPVHWVRATADPYPRNGYCRLGACSWFETHEQQIMSSTEHERLVRVALATGRSAHPDNAFPRNASSARIQWTRQGEQAFILCSRWRPAVMRRPRGRDWEMVRIDLVRGMGDFGESQKSIYGLVCHLEEDWTAEGFFARRGYRPQSGPAVTRVAHPQAVPMIFPNDPERPDQGGMAVTNSAPAEALEVRMAPPPSMVIDARPPPERSGPTELVVATPEGDILEYLGTYPSLAACERARAVRANDPRTVCSVGERSRFH